MPPDRRYQMALLDDAGIRALDAARDASGQLIQVGPNLSAFGPNVALAIVGMIAMALLCGAGKHGSPAPGIIVGVLGVVSIGLWQAKSNAERQQAVNEARATLDQAVKDINASLARQREKWKAVLTG